MAKLTFSAGDPLRGKPVAPIIHMRPDYLCSCRAAQTVHSLFSGSACVQSSDAAAQRSDQYRAVREMLLFRIENLHETPLLQRHNRIPFAIHIKPRRVANDVDQPIQCVNTAQKVIIFAIGAREERREMRKTNAFETAASAEFAERIGILRTDAIDQDFIELTDFTPSHDWECQNIPKWKSEIVDQNLTTRVRMP